MIEDGDNAMLEAIPSEEEVKSAVWVLKQDSASGPDGFTGLFYRRCWDIIGKDVIESAIAFFQGLSNPTAVPCASLMLIPKVPNQATFSDFRPLSLCTFLNKIICKIIANRLI